MVQIITPIQLWSFFNQERSKICFQINKNININYCYCTYHRSGAPAPVESASGGSPSHVSMQLIRFVQEVLAYAVPLDPPPLSTSSSYLSGCFEGGRGGRASHEVV